MYTEVSIPNLLVTLILKCVVTCFVHIMLIKWVKDGSEKKKRKEKKRKERKNRQKINEEKKKKDKEEADAKAAKEDRARRRAEALENG